MLRFFAYSTAEKRDEIFCVYEVPAAEIVDALGKMSIRDTDPHRIGDFLIKEFCS